jgi:hypothetical protein
MKQKTRKLKGLSPSNVLPNPRGPSNAFSYSDDIVKFAEVTYFIYFYFFFSLTSFLIDKYIYIYIYIYIWAQLDALIHVYIVERSNQSN